MLQMSMLKTMLQWSPKGHFNIFDAVQNIVLGMETNGLNLEYYYNTTIQLRFFYYNYA